MSFTKNRYFSRAVRAIALSADTLGDWFQDEALPRRRPKRYRDRSRQSAEGRRVYDRYDWKKRAALRPISNRAYGVTTLA